MTYTGKIYQSKIKASIESVRVVKEGEINGKRYFDVCLFSPDPSNKWATEDSVWSRIWTNDTTKFLTDINVKDIISVEGFLSIAIKTIKGKRYVNTNINASEICKKEIKYKKHDDESDDQAPFVEHGKTYDTTPAEKEDTTSDDIPF